MKNYVALKESIPMTKTNIYITTSSVNIYYLFLLDLQILMT